MTVLCLLLLATWQRTIANGECGGVQIKMLSHDGRKKHYKYKVFQKDLNNLNLVYFTY